MAKIRIHNLKMSPVYFKDILKGDRKFDVRQKDESYHIGDIVTFEEFDMKSTGYTGRYINAEITYILDDPQWCKEDYIMFSFRKRLDRGAVI